MEPKLLQILRHALGIGEDGRGKTTRDYYCTGPESEDFDLCQILVADSYMVDQGAKASAGGMHLFTVTLFGAVAATDLSPPAKPTRGQRLYQHWLEISECYPGAKFGDFITRPEFAESRERALT